MKTATSTTLLLAIALTGCAAGLGRSPDMAELMRQSVPSEDDMDNLEVKSRLMQEMMNSPDLPAWHEQREKMALAIGDRQFDKSFDRVFDSMTVALATLGCRVNNMERASGYITASIPELPPAQLQALHAEGARQYAVAKGYPADVFDKKGGRFDTFVDPSNLMSRYMSGLTLSMVKQGPELTKIKLRFDNVYYPGLVDQYYSTVWQAVDKQMFLDKGLD
jgi:hypothetical protein